MKVSSELSYENLGCTSPFVAEGVAALILTVPKLALAFPNNDSDSGWGSSKIKFARTGK
ncbi:MAG: hypothetical protein Ct9H90mP28_1130 [Paracoccaceae bacterium]|nr:MAG: hypothetical protein Ct9H90mP28_1130 [Paracoccaceae bacterium]